MEAVFFPPVVGLQLDDEYDSHKEVRIFSRMIPNIHTLIVQSFTPHVLGISYTCSRSGSTSSTIEHCSLSLYCRLSRDLVIQEVSQMD
ncbi:hypothetical protein J6590_005251 [Homalodisca vitripennis]|nr:hypothetical protein J6590_005251 [Homalodisca vitripennis]